MILDYSLSYQRHQILWQTLRIMSLLERFRRMFMVFENFFIVCNNDNWCIGIDETEIKKIFKVAYSLEQFCNELKEKNLSEVFNDKLIEYFRVQGHIDFSDCDLFKKACDILLSKFLTDSRPSDDIVKLAIDQYCNYCGENRFTSLTEELIHNRRAYLELSRFVENACDPVDIEARFIFESWCKRLNFKTVNSISLDESVMEMFTLNLKSIKIVFLILCFEDENESCKIIHNCIVSKLISTILLKNTQVWRCFVQLPLENIRLIVRKFPEVLNSIFDIITHTSGNFYCNYSDNKMQWLQKTPEGLSYKEILKTFKVLYSIGNEVRDRVVNYFNSRKSSEYCLFFEDIECEVLKIINSETPGETKV